MSEPNPMPLTTLVARLALPDPITLQPVNGQVDLPVRVMRHDRQFELADKHAAGAGTGSPTGRERKGEIGDQQRFADFGSPRTNRIPCAGKKPGFTSRVVARATAAPGVEPTRESFQKPWPVRGWCASHRGQRSGR